MRRPVSFAPPDWSTPLMGRWGSGMTSALLRWEAEVGGERGHGAGGFLAAVANVGALAVICPEAKTHKPALPANSCSHQTPGLVSTTTTSHKSKWAVVSAHLDKTCEPAQTQLQPTAATNRKSQLLTGSIISMAAKASRKHANMLMTLAS